MEGNPAVSAGRRHGAIPSATRSGAPTLSPQPLQIADAGGTIATPEWLALALAVLLIAAGAVGRVSAHHCV